MALNSRQSQVVVSAEYSYQQRVLVLLVLIVCSLVISCKGDGAGEEALAAPTNDVNRLALKPVESSTLIRLKRQQSVFGALTGSSASSNNVIASQQAGGSAGSSGSGSSSSSAPSAGASSSSSEGTSNNPQDNLDDRPPEEALNNLRCDFGTTDSPDLCKFKILDSANPLSKGLASWTLGSGKLALYQGGPLIDASDRNDTTGGYIFLETSNPYASAPPMANHSGSSASMGGHHDQMMGGHDGYYSVISTSNFMKAANHRHTTMVSDGMQMGGGANNFQHVSSPRVSVMGGGGGAGGQLGPAFLSPNLTAPGPSGMCLSFQYAIQGLSADELRIYVNDHKTERSRQIWTASESAGSNWTKGEVLYSVTNMHSIMFSASQSAASGSKDLQQRKFRGHIALDEIEINRHDSSGNDGGACKGHCNFDGDLCGWTNAENGQEDDFDWSFGRGSDNLFTGPSRDYISSTNNELTGSYLYTDSGYPRRPGDRALLISSMFQPTAVNDAMCMRLAVHMFGSGVGSLAIKIRYADADVPAPAELGPIGGAGSSTSSGGQQPGQPALQAAASTRPDGRPNNDLVIWEMSGDAGNNWHQAQTSVSSSKSAFQVLIEGVIGENHLGNIAIDEISLSPGPCPTSPPVASKNYGDCTFEQSMCYWRNPDADIHLDDLDWIRSADEQSIHGPNFDHTLKKRSGSFLKLENTFREPKSGTRAFLLSPIFQPKPQSSVQCLSFYYYMFMRSISSSGPNLGTIRIYLASNNELVPIWRLTNPISSPNWKHGRASLSTSMLDGQPVAPTKLFQIAFEGIWGDAPGGAIALDDITVFDGACEIMPPEAKSVPGECTFDVDMCSWTNKSSELTMSSMTDPGRSPFLQSVNIPGQQSTANSAAAAHGKQHRMSWQLATVDSRPVNLQDHTYKAPIGYAYVDVLDGGAQRMAFPLQSAEISIPNGQQQVTQCLSFWFAAYGRQENNQLNVHITQQSAPPPPPDDSSSNSSQGGGGGGGAAAGAAPNRASQQGGSASGAQSSGSAAAAGAAQPLAASSSMSTSGNSAATGSGGADSDSENPNAWKMIDGKLIWSISLKNITEMNKRKWQYGQVTIKADSNYIVRFIAHSNDGGFALDDVSYYEGACETRPALAKVISEEDSDISQPIVKPVPAS